MSSSWRSGSVGGLDLSRPDTVGTGARSPNTCPQTGFLVTAESLVRPAGEQILGVVKRIHPGLTVIQARWRDPLDPALAVQPGVPAELGASGYPAHTPTSGLSMSVSPPSAQSVSR